MSEHAGADEATDEDVRAAAEKLLARINDGAMTFEEAALILTAAYGDRGRKAAP